MRMGDRAGLKRRLSPDSNVALELVGIGQRSDLPASLVARRTKEVEQRKKEREERRLNRLMNEGNLEHRNHGLASVVVVDTREATQFVICREHFVLCFRSVIKSIASE
jgi:hypothetical protein